MKRIVLAWMLAALLTACVAPLQVLASATAESRRTLKVAYPLQEGLTMADGEGNYSGYTYEYLLEMSKYTLWQYEIVLLQGDSNEQATKALAMLEAGEVDLLGGLNYDQSLAETLAYPGHCYGINYMGLFVPYSSRLSESTLYTSGTIRVGLYRRTSEKNPKLDQFARMNNLDIEQVVVDSKEELRRMVQSGEVDAVLSTDLSVSEHRGMRAIAYFSPTPFYFATKRGNADIVRKLDDAISTIDRVTPNFSPSLYNQYFSEYNLAFRLTNEENAYVNRAGVQEVAILEDNPPFCYRDEQTGELAGIMAEVLDAFSQMTGLRFHLNPLKTHQQYQAFVAGGRADLCANALVNRPDAASAGALLTLPWHSLPISRVYKEGADLSQPGSRALTQSLRNLALPSEAPRRYELLDFIEAVTGGELQAPLYLETSLECMQAVKNGRVQSAYIDEFSGQYHMNSEAFNNLKMIRQQDVLTQQLSFGVLDRENLHLLSILNKCVSHLPAEKMEEIFYRNTYRQQLIPLSVWILNNLGPIVMVAMFLFILSLFIYIQSKGREQRRIAFENQRYSALDELTNEFLYEYNLSRDELLLPKKCAQYFSCDTKIERLAQRLSAMAEENLTGIWKIASFIVRDQAGDCELSCPMPAGPNQWFRVIHTPLCGQLTISYAVGKIVNIQDLKNEQMRLEQKAYTDGLTGLYNVTAVKSMVRQRLKRFDECAPCAFIVLDIDHFKRINDQFGHYTGDMALIHIASLLSEIFQPHLTGRLGGDEFVAFVERTSREELDGLCGKLCQAGADKIQALLGVPGSLSIGVTLAHEKKSYDCLYREADAALYDRKSSTKNGYSFYDARAERST